MTFANRIARSLPLTVLACAFMVLVTFGGIYLGFSLLGLNLWTQVVAGMVGVMGMRAVGWMVQRYSQVQRILTIHKSCCTV